MMRIKQITIKYKILVLLNVINNRYILDLYLILVKVKFKKAHF